MRGIGDLERIVYSLIDRYLGGGTGHVGGNRYYERHLMVTSFDPVNYLAKGTYQPEGQESGWLPIEAGHIGEGYGIAVGLQPGDGKSTGDQVIVRFQEGDLESAKVVQRVHSDDEKPPTVQSGEIVIWAKFKNTGGGDDSAQGGQAGTGQQIFLKKDGSLSLTDGNGATGIFDGNGNIKLTAKLLQIDVQTLTAIASGDLGLKSGGVTEIKAGGKLGLDSDDAVVRQGKGDVSDGSVSPPQAKPPVPPDMVPA